LSRELVESSLIFYALCFKIVVQILCVCVCVCVYVCLPRLVEGGSSLPSISRSSSIGGCDIFESATHASVEDNVNRAYCFSRGRLSRDAKMESERGCGCFPLQIACYY